MKKSKVLLGFIVTLSLLTFIGCKRNDDDRNTVSEENISVTAGVSPTVTVEPTDANENENEVDLLELSKEYANQFVKLEFKKVVENSTEEVKKQISEEYLKSVWQSTVEALGAYIDIYSQDMESEDDKTIVKTVMKFEENGLLLTLSYNKEQQVKGLWFSYQSLEEENVESEKFTEYDISVGSSDLSLEGKLTLPNGVSKPPVVILVQGSGTTDLDETVGAVGNKPFRDIAHRLAERGIASIRYNKRFYQYADQATDHFTIYDEVLNDVSYAIDLAAADDRVDGSKIYIIGHSLGGMLAPKIATDNPEVAGIVSLAGTPRNLEDLIFDQAKDAMDLQTNLTEEDKIYAIGQYEEMIKSIKNLDNGNLGEAILGVTGYYWKSLNEIDTKSLVQELTIPMLFLQGSEDFQVYADVDFEEWKTILKGNENASFVLYDGLNHMFMKSNGLSDAKEYDIKGSVDVNVIEDIAEWILIRE